MIFSDEETKTVLINKLTLLIVENIQSEFEDFFHKLCNNGHEVVREIINLTLKVVHLKEKTNFLQANDMHSAFRFINFEMKLDDLSAVVLKVYLESIKAGDFNSKQVQFDLNVHLFCVQTMKCLRIIHLYRIPLANAIAITCNHIDPQNLNDSETSNLSDVLAQRREIKRQISNESNDSDFQFSIYFDHIIDGISQFLANEANKIELDSDGLDHINFMSSNSLNTFKMLLKYFKVNVFLINNFDFVQKFLHDLKISSNQQSKLKIDLEKCMETACQVFDFILQKWTKLAKRNKEKNKTKRKKSEIEFMIKETLYVCRRVLIANEKSKSVFKECVQFNLKPIIKQFNQQTLESLAEFISTNHELGPDQYEETILSKLFT